MRCPLVDLTTWFCISFAHSFARSFEWPVKRDFDDVVLRLCQKPTPPLFGFSALAWEVIKGEDIETIDVDPWEVCRLEISFTVEQTGLNTHLTIWKHKNKLNMILRKGSFPYQRTSLCFQLATWPGNLLRL